MQRCNAGNLPGPDLLLKVLTNQLTPKEAKEAWKQHEKEQEEKEDTQGCNWKERIPLCCRTCTKNNDGVEVRQPLSLFTRSAYKKEEEVWRAVVAQGHDLQCSKCLHRARDEPDEDEYIACDGCLRQKFRSEFDPSQRSA